VKTLEQSLASKTQELRDMEARRSQQHGLSEDSRDLLRQLNAANTTIKSMTEGRDEVSRQHLSALVSKENDIRTLHGEVASLKARIAKQTEEHGVVFYNCSLFVIHSMIPVI
jgi:seryl-tRNA synthetase